MRRGTAVDRAGPAFLDNDKKGYGPAERLRLPATAIEHQVTSNLDCVGLGVKGADDLTRLVSRALPGSVSLGVVHGLDVRRWQDPSGSRLVLGVQDGKVADLLPSYAGAAVTWLARVRPLTEDVAEADVVDANGETITRLAFELEERRFLPTNDDGGSGAASLVALGVDVSLHDDEETFARSPESLLRPENEAEPPAKWAERSFEWPPRVAAESFISFGLFAKADAHARLHGRVLEVERKAVALTGQEFLAVTLRTAGFEPTLCVPVTSLPTVPRPGHILGGSVFLVGSMPALAPTSSSLTVPRRRRRLRRAK